MRYFITGSAGFIGFHLARRLLAAGHEVVGFDGMTSYYNVPLKEARHAALAQYPAFKSHTGRLEDAELLSRLVETTRPDVVFHLAAQAGVRYSLENPQAYLGSNLVGSWNVLEAVRKVGVQHLLLASTSSIYGASPTVPFFETDCANEPLTFYAASKKGMEAMGHSYAHLHKIPTTSFRFFTVYGPWGRPDMALFKFVSAILEDREIEIYGDGRMSRDFTYVDDLVDAVVALSAIAPEEGNRVSRDGIVDTLSHTAPYRVVNIGGGQPTNLLDFVETIERVVGRPARRKMLPMQKGDVQRTFASDALLNALIGSRAITPLEVGVRAFVDWYLESRDFL